MNGTLTDQAAGTGQSKLTSSPDCDKKGTGKRLRVLIVEDHEASRYCLEGVLQKEGYSVRSMSSGERGIEWLEADRFDVLLTDLHLPGIDGFDLIAKAKAVQPSIHILMMTAAVGDKVCERAQAEGVEMLMAKPLELDRILTFLDSIVSRETQWERARK